MGARSGKYLFDIVLTLMYAIVTQHNIKVEVAMHPNTKHGYKGTRTYNTWISMKHRCSRPDKHRDYKNYTGRGITVCSEWSSSFENFLRDMGVRPDGMTIDRIDNDKGYYKENCRWATNKEQLRNTRINRMLEFQGERKCLQEWADISGIKAITISARLRRGWSVDKALSTKLNATRKGKVPNQKLVTYKGETRNIKDWARHFGIDYHLLQARLSRYKWPFEKAVSKR